MPTNRPTPHRNQRSPGLAYGSIFLLVNYDTAPQEYTQRCSAISITAVQVHHLRANNPKPYWKFSQARFFPSAPTPRKLLPAPGEKSTAYLQKHTQSKQRSTANNVFRRLDREIHLPDTGKLKEYLFSASPRPLDQSTNHFKSHHISDGISPRLLARASHLAARSAPRTTCRD